MKSSDSNSQGSSASATPLDMGFHPLQRLKSKRISYLAVPLIVMATITEFVILATGWKYQQKVCLPPGMGVTFFGIGPIGATMLAVELLKLPLAIWTASRHGWQKAFMLCIGLPLICVLTFQLVKDMAVYEMGTAMLPASQALEKATAEEVKINQLKDDLAVIEKKRVERETKLSELGSKQAKTKADLEDALQRNETSRQDAINLTDYQKKELSEVETRQATIIQQFNSDTEQLTKAIADLRARREAEFARSAKDSADWEKRKAAYDAAYAKWHTEDARIDNAYKTGMADYANKKAAYEKDSAAYAAANVLKRQLMKKPVDPGVPPVREANKFPKPDELDGRPSALIAEIDAEIKAKEAELLTVNNKRRDRVAQVDTDARRLREEFDRRSTTKREETDRKREELSAALAALVKEEKAERDQIDQEFAGVVQKVGSIRAEIDACRKKAEGFYEEREASIRKTQVHRIATTVEIVRGLIMGERPMSIKITPKERGDILSDQISMVRIWVYPVLAFIVAFLPTLMVEIGFTTVFQPERQRPEHRLGFLGSHLHALYTRAGRQKILRAERVAQQATAQLAGRDRALADANAVAERALLEKEAELQEARENMGAAAAAHAEQVQKMADEHAEQVAKKDAAYAEQMQRLKAEHAERLQSLETERTEQVQRMAAEHTEQIQRMEMAHAEQLQREGAEHAEQSKTKEAGWVAKLGAMADSLNRAIVEKDALRDLQKSEIERQVQMRQNAWSERLTRMRQELDDQRAASEAERTALMQEHHKKLVEVSETCRTQVIQARRQMEEAELAAVEKSARLAHDLQEASHARETAEAQLKHQAEAFSLKMSQAQENAARELEKSAREQKHRSELQQMEFEKTLRQREEDFQRQLKQREQELSLAFEARLGEEKNKFEQEAHAREAELERQAEARVRAVDAQWRQEIQQWEESAQFKLKQREQQLQTQAEVRLRDVQTQAEQELRRRELELERQLEAQSREAERRLKQDLQQQEAAFQGKVKQREEELAIKAGARETELQNQWAADLRARQEEWEHQVESRVRAAETRLSHEAQQKEELFQSKLRQRDQQWQTKLDAARAEVQSQTEEVLRAREAETNEARQALEARLRKEMQQKEDAAQAQAKKREQELLVQLTAQADSRLKAAQAQWEAESEKRARTAVQPFMTLLDRAEKERDEAKQAASASARQAQQLEEKLAEAASFLNGWGNGKKLVVADAN